MKPHIILVHGAWHRGSCFSDVARHLEKAGFEVSAPDLASHGPADIDYLAITDLRTYTAPVASLLAALDQPAILVGHSMGGASVSWLGEHHSEKLGGLVYLAAFMVGRGRTPLEYISRDAVNPAVAEFYGLLEPVSENRGIKLELSRVDALTSVLYGDYVGSARAFVGDLVEVQSTVPHVTPTALSNERLGSLPRLYVETTLDKVIPIESQRQMQRDWPGAMVATLEASHSPFHSVPGQVSRLIEDFAAGVQHRQTPISRSTSSVVR